VQPELYLEDMGDGLHVIVAPSSVDIATSTRSTDQYDCTVDLALQRKLATGAGAASVDEQVAAHLEYVRAAAKYLRRRALAGAAWAKNVSMANSTVIYEPHLRQHGVMTSVLRLTYRAIEA
jgi:hypothetical protein